MHALSQPQEKPVMKRLSINLPEPAFNELRRLSDFSHRSMTEVVRTALSLAKIAFEEESQGHKLVIADRSGDPIKEIVLP